MSCCLVLLEGSGDDELARTGEGVVASGCSCRLETSAVPVLLLANSRFPAKHQVVVNNDARRMLY